MADAQPVEAKTGSRLDLLVKKYGYQPGQATPRQQVQVAFDSQSVYQQDKARLQRISQGPRTSANTSTGQIHAEMAGIQLELAELAEEYGRLNVRLGRLMGKDKLYTAGDVLKIAYNSAVRNKSRVRQIKVDAAARKGNAFETLVDEMAKVLAEQYQKAVDGKSKAESLQVENVAHLKNLDQKLIASLKGGYHGTADYAAAENEVKSLETELSEIEQLLMSYEKDVNTARTGGDIEKVQKLTDEMSQVLDIKHGVLDGRLSAEGVVSEIRRQILNSTEAVQSAKGAAAASQVNYRVINALIDSYSELEIKYRHAKEDMIPVFQIQGKSAALGLDALHMRDTLVRVANVSQRLMEANSRMAMHLATETFELLQTPLYDPVRARQVEDTVRTYMTELNKRKLEWAEQVQTVTQPTQQPHYAQHK